jgi:hypothetical protein
MVIFHTTSYRKTLTASSNTMEPFPSAEYEFETTQEFAPRFVRAFKHAAELCGAKPSPF